jgi:predicted DNA-binding transcriptional regulator YafY
MPQIDKKSTLLRQWEMMRMLTVSRSDSKHDGRWDKASEIAVKLNDAGYDVSVRTVQRDLKELSEIFPIELNDKNARDYGWRWIKGANLDIPGMSVPEALAMRLVETHLKQLLPASMLDGLNGVFSLAQSKLDKVEKQNNNHSKDWLNKVRVVPPAQPLLPPVVNEAVQATIYRGLLDNKQLMVSYQSASSEHSKGYVLNPLGLIMRGAVTYLVASARDYVDARLYALHRFSQVEILVAAAKTPEGFNLDTALANGLADFANQGEPIHLELRCTEDVAAFLAETPLAADQTLTPEPDGWVRLTATVNDTRQLHWWLLGQGDGVEVYAPENLRLKISNSLEEALGQYQQKNSSGEVA